MTRILIADDIGANLYLLESILKGNGYGVTSAKNGAEALASAKKDPPDLIITDILMPVMDGYETARELRKIPDVSSTPIVALTSYAMAGDREKALAAGCTGYIEKPINPKKFTEQVAQYVPADISRGDGG